MGMPESIINFKENAHTFMRRLGRGTVCYVLINEKAATPEYYTINARYDVDEALKGSKVATELTDLTKQMFDLGASKVLIAAGATFDAIKTWLLGQRYNYLATDAATAEIIAWCENIQFRAGSKFILFSDGAAAVATNTKATDKAGYIVNVYPESKDAVMGKPAHIAAVVAGCNDRAATNIQIGQIDKLTDAELAKYPASRSDDANTKINEGKLTVVNDGKYLVVGRGITSYYKYASEGENTTKSPFSKIRCVDTLNLVEDDIRTTFDTQFSGKVLNDYANKMAFISLVNTNYFADLIGTALHPEGINSVDIDVAKHIEIIKAEGGNPDNMSEMEIRKYPTGDVLYLAGYIRPLDAMEDMVLNFSVN